MRRHRHLCAYLLAVSFLLWPTVSSAHTPIPYQDEGYFVSWPAVVAGAAVALPVAAGGALLCAPIDLIQSIGDPSHEYTLTTLCAGVPALVVGIPVALVVGAPFYGIKKVFWDFPRYLMGEDHGSPPPAEGKVPAGAAPAAPVTPDDAARSP